MGWEKQFKHMYMYINFPQISLRLFNDIVDLPHPCTWDVRNKSTYPQSEVIVADSVWLKEELWDALWSLSLSDK